MTKTAENPCFLLCVTFMWLYRDNSRHNTIRLQFPEIVALG